MSEAKLDLILGKLGQVANDVAGLKQDVAGLKQDIAELKQDVADINVQLSRHEKMIVQLIGIVKSTNEKVSVLTERLDAFDQRHQKLEYSIDILNREQFRMKTDVEMLKNR